VPATGFPPGAALVIGGSGGIGSAICRELARGGTDVALTYRTRSKAAADVASDVRALGRVASVYVLDAGDPDAIVAVLCAALQQHARVHTVVFSAAAVTEQLHISRITRTLWRRALDEEVSGFFHAVQAALPHFRAAGGGSFVHIGSVGHLLWPARDGLSVIPKAANEAIVRGIAREEGRFNIRANSVLVGVVNAGMHLELQRQGILDDQWRQNTLAAVPLKRIGTAEDIAHAAVYLASGRANYVTGQQISVAGGFGV
jgi:3-oxoacyl-[acyl-carrier protein] reductase